MATRNSAPRRLPGSPLAGVLRQTARAARSTTYRTVSVPGPEGPAGPPGEDAMATGFTATAVAVLTCDDMGVAVIDYPATAGVPVVLATAGPYVASVFVAETTATSATVVALGPEGQPAAQGTIHVAVFDAPAPVDLPEQPATEGP